MTRFECVIILPLTAAHLCTNLLVDYLMILFYFGACFLSLFTSYVLNFSFKGLCALADMSQVMMFWN